MNVVCSLWPSGVLFYPCVSMHDVLQIAIMCLCWFTPSVVNDEPIARMLWWKREKKKEKHRTSCDCVIAKPEWNLVREKQRKWHDYLRRWPQDLRFTRTHVMSYSHISAVTGKPESKNQTELRTQIWNMATYEKHDWRWVTTELNIKTIAEDNGWITVCFVAKI